MQKFKLIRHLLCSGQSSPDSHNSRVDSRVGSSQASSMRTQRTPVRRLRLQACFMASRIPMRLAITQVAKLPSFAAHRLQGAGTQTDSLKPLNPTLANLQRCSFSASPMNENAPPHLAINNSIHVRLDVDLSHSEALIRRHPMRCQPLHRSSLLCPFLYTARDGSIFYGRSKSSL